MMDKDDMILKFLQVKELLIRLDLIFNAPFYAYF